MNHQENQARFIAVDLANFISLHYDSPMMVQIRSKFPIKELISSILKNNHYVYDPESMFYQVEERFGSSLEGIDLDVLEFGFEAFTLMLDEYIRHHVPMHIDSGEYIIDRWIDSTTVLLKHDETARMLSHTWTNPTFGTCQVASVGHTRVFGLYNRGSFTRDI